MRRVSSKKMTDLTLAIIVFVSAVGIGLIAAATERLHWSRVRWRSPHPHHRPRRGFGGAAGAAAEDDVPRDLRRGSLPPRHNER